MQTTVEQLYLNRTLTSTVTAEAIDPEIVAGFRRVCESHLEAVFSYIRYRVASGDGAEELTGTTFLKGLERLRSFDPQRGEMTHWLFAIARHLVTDHLRAQRRWTWVPIDWLTEPASRDMSPEQSVSESELHQQLLHALRRVRNRDRDVIGMRFGAGLTNREIATITGFISERHVAVLLQRALARLRVHLESQGVTNASGH